MRESATAAILDGNGRLLLQLRSDVPVWVLPGGGVESGETPLQAVAREVFEETGLSVRPVRYVGRYTAEYMVYRDITHVFACRIIGGKLRRNAESLKLGFFSPGKLPRPMLSIHRERALDAAKGVRNDEKVRKVNFWQVLKDVHFSVPIMLRFVPFSMRMLLPLQKIFK